MGKRKKRRTPSPVNAPAEGQFSVEVIKAARKVDGEWEYLVKWYGFGDDENSWEPTENFHDCERLLNSFWAEVGEHKREKTREEIEVIPRKQWIEKEKKLFRETRKEEERAPREAAQKAVREAVQSESDEDDIPLRELVEKSIEGVASSDDDEPLSVSLRRPTTFKETGLLQPQEQRSDAATNTTRAASNKITKRAARTDTSSAKKKLPPIATNPPPLTSANEPEPGPSKSPETSSAARSPAETRTPHLVAHDSFVDTQASSLSSRRQPTNQATGSDHRGPEKTQPVLYSIQHSSALSTKARIAEDMKNGPTPVNQSKYKGMRIRKGVNPSEESGSPIISATKSPQTPFDLPQRTSLPLSSNGQINQVPTRKASLQQHSPPPPQLEEPSHDTELDRMDVDQPGPSPSPPRPRNLTAADDLLHTIIPQQIPELMPKVSEKPAARSSAKITPSESPRDTRWSGNLFNCVSETDAEKLCEVTIQDHTTARGGLKLDLFLQKSDSIRLRKFHDLTDLDLLLPSFQHIAQFASLVPCGDKDKEAFAVMQEYLFLKEKFTYCALSFVNEVQVENDTVAYMFITPTSKSALALLGAPEHMEKKNTLLVALAPLTVPTKKYHEEIGIVKLREEVKTRFHTLPDLEDSVFLSAYHLARHILGVPKSLVTFLSSGPRLCVIWPLENTTNDTWISQDTQYLRFVLDHHRAKVFSPSERIAARIVFVHVGRMKDVHNMPRIARMRGTPLDLQFLTYGAHPSVPAREWGIRGFNISGGILTFTPNAIASDLDGVDRLIERVSNHEHWACYITPTVLGAAVQRAKDSGNPASAAVISDRLGKRITEGKIACMIAPPTNSHLGRYAKDCDMWVEYQHMQSLLDPQEITEDCEGMYEDAYGSAKQDRDGLVLSDLEQDLVKMSNQPAIRYAYRRFVIIKSSTDVHGRPGEQDWCEWKLVSGFRFGDEVDT